AQHRTAFGRAAGGLPRARGFAGQLPRVRAGRSAGRFDGHRLVRATGRARRGTTCRQARSGRGLPRADRTGAAIVTTFPAGTFTPKPGAGRRGRMLATHARVETTLTL